MSIAVMGEALIDFIMGPDGAYRPHLGGSPYNVAIGLARQGIPVSYLNTFSDDEFGTQLAATLKNEQVLVPDGRRSRWPTSLALITLNNQGVPSYRLYREGIADKDTSFEEILKNLPEDLRVFHTGSLAITPSQLPKIRKLFEQMKTQDVIVSMDINIRLGASLDTGAYLSGVRSLLPLADIVKASDEDLESLQLSPDTRRAAELAHAEMQDGLLVLTEGSGGAFIYQDGATIETTAYPVARVEDTIGAGDTFHAAFLSELCRRGANRQNLASLDRSTLERAVDFACAAAAINVSRAGCNPPTRFEVEQFIEATNRS